MPKNRFLFLLILLLGLILAAAACGGSDDDTDTPAPTDTPPATIEAEQDAAAEPVFESISVTEAYTRFSQSDTAILVDVREENEWAATGYPEGAELIALTTFEQEVPRKLTDKNTEVYLICNSGNRSMSASEYLLQMGYMHVINIEGGFQDWMSAGLPIEQYTP
ncbi:MAG: hypothetical protein JW966_06525 [Anaerolineae bacterium]|nr:hypothetical protein [Anaerolineae bacterium]